MGDEVTNFFEKVIHLVKKKTAPGEDETQYVYCLFQEYKTIKPHLAHYEIKHIEYQLNWLIKEKVQFKSKYFNWLRGQTIEARKLKAGLKTKVAMINSDRRHKYPKGRVLKEF